MLNNNNNNFRNFKSNTVVPLQNHPIEFEIGGGAVKVTKDHQVQIFKKSIFELLCTEKAFYASWEGKIRSRSPNVIMRQFSKTLIFELTWIEKAF